MKKQTISYIILTAVLISTFSVILTPARAVPSNPEPIDIGPRLRDKDIPINFGSLLSKSAEAHIQSVTETMVREGLNPQILVIRYWSREAVRERAHHRLRVMRKN